MSYTLVKVIQKHRSFHMLKKVLFILVLFFLTPGFSFSKNNEFISFLKSYGAYDIINIELKGSYKEPLLLLSYANAKIFSGKPDEAISILEHTVFKEKKLLAKREIILARAYRYKGDFETALLHYTKGYNLTNDPKLILNEPGIHNFFKIVFLKWSFDTLYNGKFLIDKNEFLQKKREILKAIDMAQKLWPKDKELASISKCVLRITPDDFSFKLADEHLRDSIISFLASISIKDKKAAILAIKLFKDPNQRQLLQLFLKKLYGNDLPKDHNLLFGFPKYSAYFEIFVKNLDPDKWIIDNGSELLNKLKEENNNVELSLCDIINKEIHSVFVPQDIKEKLRQIKIAIILKNNDYPLLKKEVSKVDFKKLPISLKISILLLLDKVSSLNIGISMNEFKEIVLFLQPFGFNPFNLHSSFKISKEELDNTLKIYPLDYLLRYSYVSNLITRKQVNNTILKQAIVLYKNTISGQMAILELAKNEVLAGNFTLFKKYIELFDYENIDQKLLINYYKIMGDYYNLKNEYRQAMSYYEKIFEISPNSLAPEELIKMALYAQKNNNIEFSKRVLNYLWNKKEKLNRKIQAEVLFWMAECDQIEEKLDLATNKYLKVYFLYKDQYIWSITALYRAALIFEQKGNLYTAQKILRDVIKNARRKSEKEAARSRLNAINRKLNKSSQNLFWF